MRNRSSRACARAEELISQLHDGERGADGALEQHLEGCAPCRRSRSELTELSGLLAVAEEAPDPYFVTRFRARLRQEGATADAAESWRWLFFRLVPLSLAAATAAVLTVSMSQSTGGELGDLELQALRSGLTEVTAETLVVDRVLGLDLGSLPSGIEEQEPPRHDRP